MRLNYAEWQSRLGDEQAARNEYSELITLTTNSGYCSQTRFVERSLAESEQFAADWLMDEPQLHSLMMSMTRQAIRISDWETVSEVLGTEYQDFVECLFAGAVAALLGDEQRYAQASKSMEIRLPLDVKATDPWLDFYPPCLQMVRPMQGLDAVRFRSLAEKAYEKAPSGGVDHERLMGLAHYRNGNYAAAKEYFFESLKGTATWHFHALTWPMMAMVCWQMGEHEVAHQWMELCEWFSRYSHDAARIPESTGPFGCEDLQLLQFEALYREARRLITESPMAVDGSGRESPSATSFVEAGGR